MIAVGTFLETLVEVIWGALALVGFLTVLVTVVVYWLIYHADL